MGIVLRRVKGFGRTYLDAQVTVLTRFEALKTTVRLKDGVGQDGAQSDAIANKRVDDYPGTTVY